MHQITREKNYFLSFLFLKFSEYQNLDPLSNTFGAASQAVLTDYLTVDEIVATPLEELAQLLAKEGRNHFPSPESIAAIIKRAARDSYRLHPALNEPLNLILLLFCFSKSKFVLYFQRTRDKTSPSRATGQSLNLESENPWCF
jgi:hypothetical protein